MATAKDHGVGLYDAWEVFAHGLTAFAAVISIFPTRTEGWSSSPFTVVERTALTSATVFGVAVGWWRGRRRRRQQQETAAWSARSARSGAPRTTERMFGVFVAKASLFLVRFALFVVWIVFVANHSTRFEHRVDGRPVQHLEFGSPGPLDPPDPLKFQWDDVFGRNVLILVIARVVVEATLARSRSRPPGFE